MAEIYYARTDVSYSGGDKFFTITFSYIKKEHINVYVNDEKTENFTFNTDSQIVVNDDLVVGDIVSIRRTTPIDDRMVVFSDTSILNKDAQNLAQEQLFDAVQEIYDNNIQFKIDTNKLIENNKSELESQLSDFENEVNTKIEEVSEASKKLNQLTQAVSEAKSAAITSKEMANDAEKAALDAIQAANKAQQTVDSIEQPDWSEENPESKGFIKNKPQAASGDKLGLVKIGAGINIDPDGTISAPSLPLFSTVTSDVPLADARLHLKDGSLLHAIDPETGNKGVYSDFVNEAKERYGDGSDIPDYFTDEETWQSEVAQYGVCSKYVYDPANNTLRLPKVSGFVEYTTDEKELGKLTEAGAPNIVANIYNLTPQAYGTITADGAATAQVSKSGSMDAYGSTNNFTVTIDASRSSSVYGNSDTIQPQSIKMFAYVVVATEAKSEALANLDNIATDLNGKADVDLTNISNAGTSKVANWAMPSNKYIDLTLGAKRAEYIAPADGIVAFCKNTTAASQFVCIDKMYNNDIIMRASNRETQANKWASVILPVAKGDTFGAEYDAGGDTIWFRFIYTNGSEREVE